MTTFLLIRHAHHDMVGKSIAGRMSGFTLTPEGESQAEYLAEQMAMMSIDRIYSSPRERTQATAAAIAGFLNLEVQTCAGLDEIEFGEWQGRTFEDLEDDPAWRRFNRFRSAARTADGEFMLQVQARMVSVLEDLRACFPNEVIALVSHSDPIKATIACYAGISLDLMLRIEISPASVSIISLDDYGPYILCVNHTGRSRRVTR